MVKDEAEKASPKLVWHQLVISNETFEGYFRKFLEQKMPEHSGVPFVEPRRYYHEAMTFPALNLLGGLEQAVAKFLCISL